MSSSIADAFKGPSKSPLPSAEAKAAAMEQVRREGATLNARQLIESIGETVFQQCITKPGSSLSKNEEMCIKSVMEKYINAWNVVNQQLVIRIQKQQEMDTGGFSWATEGRS
ncbi:MAG: protein translocase subunit [Phylliscum demangeonii]|nr:MAG: protein translocase subunit [Phylliscum demangeonii]